MKYFTKDWCYSNLNDHEIEKRLKDYRTYISSIYKKLPFVLKVLVQNINVHDGRLKSVCFVQDKKLLSLNGIFGDLESGYFFLEIKYLKVSNPDVDLLTSVFSNQETVILSDELELLTEGLFSHRMFFSTKQDVDIQFNDIEITIKNATPKDYKKLCCQFKVM